MGNLAGNRSDFALWLVLLPGRAPAFFSDGLYISEALDSADSVRFSKSECFERLKNTNDVLRPFFGGVKRNDPDRISVLPTQVKTTPYAADGTTVNGPVLLVYFDLLDRETARETQGFDGAAVRATRQYDALGRVSQTSRPYFLAGGTPQLTTYSYDTLGRVVTETKPDGSVTQTVYHGLTVIDTNALNQTRTVTKNSQGKVVAVTDALGNTMTHAYDAVGNLVQTTDAVGNVVTATYDLRGRKIASADPDLGFWTYTYNTLGQLLTQADAKGQITSVSYDKLSRMVQRVEPDMTSVWTYDTAANGIGKLASSAIVAGPGSGFARSVSYDALGRPLQVSTTADGATYVMGATYDAHGRLSKVAYPSGFTARYGYNNLGYANQLLDDATNQVHWTANAMDAEQHLTQQTAGNGLVTTRSFSATTGRLTGIGTGGGNAVQNLSYTYDPLGNPLSRSDANTSLSETFTYDALNRLTSATVSLSPAPLVKTFSYSAIGNMLSKSDVGNYSYAPPGSPRPHAVMSTSGGTISTTFTYDPNGNQTAGLGRTIAYTSYNKPASITQGARTISFLDDTEHQRFKQVTPEGTTLYIAAFGVMAEISNPGTASAKWTEYLSVGNAKVGMRTLQAGLETLATRYFHTDHLGSISVITNEYGVVVERLSYDAWGKRRNPDGTDDPAGSLTSQTTRGFTGEEQLSVSGLVHLNGRVYDPLLARMTSADPFVTDPMNPQGWNRYSYVGNDPLAFTDPNGYSWLSSFFRSVSHAISGAFQAVTHFFQTNPIARAILQIGTTIALNVILPVLGFAGMALAATAAAGGAAVAAGLSGGNLSQVLRSAAIAGVTAAAFFGVGNATNALANYNPVGDMPAHFQPAFGTEIHAFNVAGHALVGCASSVASGGSCQSGALAGAVGAAGGPLMGGMNGAQKLVASAVLGGTASVAGGGKFANGAITGAFGYLFNAEAGRFIGGMVGGAVAGLLGIETGPGAFAAAWAGRLIGGELGSRLEDALWGNPNSLQKHFDDHGSDFGATDPIDYANKASQFFKQSQTDGLPTKIDSYGVIRVYEPATNTFGSYNPDGSTKTYFKPRSPTYWSRQPGKLQ
ncbi:RHS repeat-associated core domain-containing protein [Bradyrhizobium sp.]|uniref:RHS repeat-associated core domain-containing protein n=1 Tax=Bradyrhizobium sp. TaxID=376 RepID=UPI0025C01A9E|nr:RHS repeat-associated core domain-containing protein [Bradyrhizobium sp.]